MAAIVTAAAALAPSAQAQVHGLPRGAARAALLAEPTLPRPSGWSFPDAFSRTSGTGRMLGGALEWTDWVYDAYGAASSSGPALNSITTSADPLAPAQGSYVYPSGAAAGDGADIFRAAVGLTRRATVWRVDWDTLVDPSIPIAEWTFDTDDNAATGGSAWPAAANVSSPGIEKALVVSAEGARLLDARSGATIARFQTTVDRRARSFLVRVPRSVMPVRAAWRIRLGAGLADPTGTSFAAPTLSGGGAAPASAPRVYNMTFRTAAQEPPTYTGGQSASQTSQLASLLQKLPLLGAYGVPQAAEKLVATNFWGEADQAATLSGGEVSKFSRTVDWRALAAHRRTRPPLVKGWSDRWYATDLSLGQGVASSPNANPAFLGRVQPYAVYVPENYTGLRALPFTWLLHSASTNYNQYGGLNPHLVAQACQQRDSICASSEGFGGDGLYQGDAEHDLWQVWRQIALGYRIDPNRTVVSGYSMGGLASFVLPATYPSVFSEAMPLDGGFDTGCSSAPAGVAQEDIAAATDRTPNVRWVPQVVSDSYTDELSPYPEEVDAVDRFQAAGDRFTFFSTSAPEHITTDVLDGFSTQVATLHGTPRATTDPGTIDYTWCPNVVSDKLGLGPTSVYWLSELSERAGAAAATTRIVADDGAIPEPAESEQTRATVIEPPDAPPMQVTSGGWKPGATPAAADRLRLGLTGVSALTVDAHSARLQQGTATVTTDGPTRLTLAELPRGTVVHGAGETVVADKGGRATVVLAAGTSTITWAVRRPARRRRGERA